MKEANPKLIGLFVIGSISLVVVALLLFTAQDFLTPKRFFVAYFQQSVNGLYVGAAVRFRGIPVGKVTEISGVYEPESGHMIPRVTIEFHPESMEDAKVEEGEYTLLPLLLEQGMRASLKSSSLLTKQLYVALEFQPDKPERYLGSKYDDAHPELPTIDSGLDMTIDMLSDLPIEEVIARLRSTLEAAEEVFKNPHVNEALATLPALLSDVDATAVDIRKLVNGDLATAVSEASQTLEVTRSSIQSLTTTVTEESLVQVSSTLTDLGDTLQLAQKRMSADDVLMYELLAAIREMRSAAQSVRDLADALEEHPEAIIRGKKRP